MISYPILLSCDLLLFTKNYYLLKSITWIVSYMTQYHSFTISGAVNISIIDFDKMNYGVMLYFFHAHILAILHVHHSLYLISIALLPVIIPTLLLFTATNTCIVS